MAQLYFVYKLNFRHLSVHHQIKCFQTFDWYLLVQPVFRFDLLYLDVDWWVAGLLLYIQTLHYFCMRKRGRRKSVSIFPVSFLSLTGSCFTCYSHMCIWVYLSLCFFKQWIPSFQHFEHFKHLSTTRWAMVEMAKEVLN